MKQFFLIILLMVSFSFAKDGQVTFLHTNDMHCQYIPQTATWVKQEPRPQIGGMVALEYHVRTQREKYPHSLVVDAGDIMTGTPLSKIKVKGALGGAFVQMMNIVGYDAFTIGNHEFDEGQASLKNLLKIPTFDVISANLFLNDKPVAPKAFEIYDVGGVKVGVIGVLLKNLSSVAAVKNLSNVTVKDPIPVINEIAQKIDPETDVIIVLSHIGFDFDEKAARDLKNVDVILGGHSHTRIKRPKKIDGVIVCQAGAKTTNLGRLTMQVKDDEVSSFDYELIDTWVDSVKSPNPKMVKLVEKYKKQIDKEYNQVIGYALVDLTEKNSDESSVGNFIADAMCEAAEVDFALINSGGIRKNIPAGPITKLDIVEVLPFTNYLETFSVTGSQLKKLVQTNAERGNRNRSILQISGIKYTYQESANGIKIKDVWIDGEKLSENMTYMGCTVDFIINGNAISYFGFQPEQITSTGLLVSDIVIDYVKKNKEIETRVEGRIESLK